jgi:hypothetical protein
MVDDNNKGKDLGMSAHHNRISMPFHDALMTHILAFVVID